jgi:large subunit ribosomal protein L6
MGTEANTQLAGLSRVGKRPVILPDKLTASVKDGVIHIEGPKGKLSRALPPSVAVAVNTTEKKISVTSSLPGRDGARMQGLIRALIATMVKGATESYTKTLELKGTGYKAEMKGTTLHMALGLSHPVIFPMPPGMTCVIPAESKGTIVVLTSADKGLIGQTAATIRSFRPPEPYAGKGVRYQGEKVRQKAGKAGKAGKAP